MEKQPFEDASPIKNGDYPCPNHPKACHSAIAQDSYDTCFNPYFLQQQQQQPHHHHEDDKDKANETFNQPQVKRSPFIPVSPFLVMDIHTFPNQMHSLKLKWPLKIGHPKTKAIFQPSIFRGNVSFKEESCIISNWPMIHVLVLPRLCVINSINIVVLPQSKRSDTSVEERDKHTLYQTTIRASSFYLLIMRWSFVPACSYLSLGEIDALNNLKPVQP